MKRKTLDQIKAKCERLYLAAKPYAIWEDIGDAEYGPKIAIVGYKGKGKRKEARAFRLEMKYFGPYGY